MMWRVNRLLKDKTLVVTVPKGTEIRKILVEEKGSQIGRVFYPNSVPESYAEQIKWERDAAVEMLEKLGYSFGNKPRRDN